MSPNTHPTFHYNSKWSHKAVWGNITVSSHSHSKCNEYVCTHARTHAHTHTHTQLAQCRTFHNKRGWYIKWALSFTGLTTSKTAAMQFPSRPVQSSLRWTQRHCKATQSAVPDSNVLWHTHNCYYRSIQLSVVRLTGRLWLYLQ